MAFLEVFDVYRFQNVNFDYNMASFRTIFTRMTHLCGVIQLQWRKLNFFDLRLNVDGGRIAEVLEDNNIAACTSGHSQIVIADDKGKVHLFSRSWSVKTFEAYQNATYLAIQLKHDPYLITVGEDEIGLKAVIKVWDISPNEIDRVPCLRVSKLTRIKATPTALAVHDNKNLMAVGFDDGLVILFRGNYTRQRSGKEVELRHKLNDTTAITGLAFRGTSHLFIASRSSVSVFNIASSGKERGNTIDDDDDVRGCKPNCSVLIHDQQFVIAKNNAIYCYTVDGRGPCYALEGVKKRIDWFRSYLVTISKDNDSNKSPMPKDKVQNDHITILDMQNRFIVFSMMLTEITAVLTEWGSFFIITEDKQVHHLDEKDLQTKLELLFKKNLFDVAIRIANSQKYDSERLIDIYTQYGDHLFRKGEPKGAIEQYIKTIGKLETSYVIKKYLEARHLEPLTLYLQELHRIGFATEDHTTLLLTCYVKLDQHDKLKEFINARDRSIDFDVEIVIKFCRQVCCEDALQLAKKHKKHDWFLQIATEDKKDFAATLDYIENLEFDDAESYMKKYGNLLMQNVPHESTVFLKNLCTDYKPKNEPLVSDAMMAGLVSRNTINRARPEEYIHLFLNNSERLVEFLEHLINCETDWPTMIYNTLIEHYVHVWSSLKDRPSQKEYYEQKVIKLLQNTEANYDKDQALIVCLMLNFKPGILYLYEEYKLYQQILRYHIAQKDMDAAVNCCRKFGAQEPHLWVEMLWCPPPSEHLPEVLNVIANQKLLSPLMVIDCLASSTTCTLLDVRKYLMNVLTTENDVINKEMSRADQLRKETEEIRKELNDATSKPMVCQASRCAACSGDLKLPSKHFLCNHSYHHHCIQSFSENENECPACVPENKKLLDILKNQGPSVQTIESFHAQLERATDGFSVVAEYFGHGVFENLLLAPQSKEKPIHPTQSDNNLPIASANKTMRSVKSDLLNYGPGAEARVRIEESKHFKQVNVDNQRPNTPKTSVLIPTSEAKMRLIEQRKNESPYSSSLEANITRFPPIETSVKRPSNDLLDRESLKSSASSRVSPISLKNKKLDKISSNLDNISVGSTNSHRDAKNQNAAALNPFEEDETNDYDNAKNPFESKSTNPFGDDDDSNDPNNPFA